MLRKQTLANIHEIFSDYMMISNYHVNLLYILRSSMGSLFCTHFTCLAFQMAPLNLGSPQCDNSDRSEMTSNS